MAPAEKLQVQHELGDEPGVHLPCDHLRSSLVHPRHVDVVDYLTDEEGNLDLE